MNSTLKYLESQLGDFGGKSQITLKTKLNLPTPIQEVHEYKVFGSDLLAIHGESITDCDIEEYEVPFAFLDLEEGFENFDSEFREDIPKDFIPFGHLHGASEVVLYKQGEKSIHKFHVADIVDEDWIAYQLENPICDFEEFIKSIRAQTVACFSNPENHAESTLIELRNGKIYFDYEFLAPTGNDVWKEYLSKCRSELDNGMIVHYASQKLTRALNYES